MSKIPIIHEYRIASFLLGKVKQTRHCFIVSLWNIRSSISHPNYEDRYFFVKDKSQAMRVCDREGRELIKYLLKRLRKKRLLPCQNVQIVEKNL